MLRILKIFFLVVLSVSSSLILSEFLIEHYFFDRVLYGKSHVFGYLNSKDYNNVNLLFTRSNGIKIIPYLDDHPTDRITNDSYTIAVIGDSYVWGEGIKSSNRFSKTLESKLNKIKPTKIYSFALPGDNFDDNLSKYLLIQKTNKIDLYIFVLVFNDILVRSGERYPSAITQSLLKDCNTTEFSRDYIAPTWDEYSRHLKNAWKNEANICVLTKGASLLPKNAIYIILDQNWEYGEMKDGYLQYMKILSQNQLYASNISMNSPGIEYYSKFWNNSKNYFQVSEIEGHPSAFANQMFADYFYYEITHNNTWKFKIK